MHHPNVARSYAVYFGGLNQMFFNPRQEITFLDHIVGTVCVFLFPFLIYFCIFSFMVCNLIHSLYDSSPQYSPAATWEKCTFPNSESVSLLKLP
jgi:hypothetical protein